MKLTKADQRQIAMSAARSQLERAGYSRNEIERTVTGSAALNTLDDMARSDPSTIAAQWYMGAGQAQFVIFHREWKKYQLAFTLADSGRKALADGNLDMASKIIDKVVRLVTA